MEIDNITSILVSQIKSYFRNNELVNKYQQVIKEYIESQYRRIKYSKNLLNRNQPEVFEKQYIPLVLQIGNYRTKFDEPEKVFIDYPNIIISGTAGVGKTTFLRYVYLRCIETAYKVPIVVELRNFNLAETPNLESFLLTEIIGTRTDYNKEWGNFFNSIGFVFLLDGFEEVEINRKQGLVKDLEIFIARNPKSNFLISSRPATGVEYILQFFQGEILPLNENDISRFIDHYSNDSNLIIRFKNSLFSEPRNVFLEYLRNPLFLSIYLLNFEYQSDLPAKRSIFFRQIFDFLYSQHDSVTKVGFFREKLSGLSKDKIEEVLKRLAFLTFVEGKNTLSKDQLIQLLNQIKKSYPNLEFENEKLLTDFVMGMTIIIQDGNFYSFYHYSIVEYFTALFISGLADKNKSKALSKLFTSDFYNRYGISENFWELSKELDEIGFLKFVIKPSLIKIQDAFENYESRILINLGYHKVIGNGHNLGLNDFQTFELLLLQKTGTISNEMTEEIFQFLKSVNEKTFSSKQDLINELESFRSTYDLTIPRAIANKILEVEKKLSSNENDFIDMLSGI